MNVLFSNLHRGLVLLGRSSIGISFPDVQLGNTSLGNRLRLHGLETDLLQLLASAWISGICDHISLNGPHPVPKGAHYRTVRRVQAKSNPERLRRRMIKRKGGTMEKAIQAIPDSARERLNLPFLAMRSKSSGKGFRLFIEHGPVVTSPVLGSFSAYGLSSTATIPWF